MQPGSIGSVTFTVSTREVFTYRGFERKRTPSFGEHAVMAGVPRLQHNGRKLDTISFPVVMDCQFKGAVPCEERIDSLLSMADDGEAVPLVLGTAYMGLWVVTEVSVNARIVHGNRILRADVTLNLTEYN